MSKFFYKNFQKWMFLELMTSQNRPFTAKTVAIATKVAVDFGVLSINTYLCTAKTVAIATKVAVEYF